DLTFHVGVSLGEGTIKAGASPEPTRKIIGVLALPFGVKAGSSGPVIFPSKTPRRTSLFLSFDSPFKRGPTSFKIRTRSLILSAVFSSWGSFLRREWRKTGANSL